MKRTPILAGFLSLLACHGWAVETGSTFQSTKPTDAQVSNWSLGWSNTRGLTGWDYVGYLNGASGVYLGNGWVLTAGHVGSAPFTLQGTTHAVVAGSVKSITDPTYGLADITLFQIENAPNLPALTMAPYLDAGDTVVMLGYGGASGGGSVETWGQNTVQQNLYLVTPKGYTYKTLDFQALAAAGMGQVVTGDSGGGDFVYRDGVWYLAGINEAVDTSGNSYMVYLSYYESEIEAAMATAVPEPCTWALGLVGGGLLLAFGRKRNGASRL